MTLLEVTGIITPVCTVLVAWLTLRNTRALKENTDLTKEVKEEVKVVKTQTDGMHTELVATKQLLGEAVGKALGKAEQREEQIADATKAATTIPTPTISPAPLHPEEHTIKVEIVKIPKEDVEVVKIQTDSIKDELIKTTQLLGEALGKAAGKAEQKKETDEDKLNAPPDKPIDVKVTNEPLITKVVTPDPKKKE